MTIYADATTAPRTMTQHEQFLLLRTTGQRFDGYRDHVLRSLALATGIRTCTRPRATSGWRSDSPATSRSSARRATRTQRMKRCSVRVQELPC
jgi:hypothetical protein